MDKSTVGGLILGAAMMALSVVLGGASFTSFVDYPSAAVVFGGALGACMTNFSMATMMLYPAVIKKTIFPALQDIKPIIKQIVELSEVARKDGILALESRTSDIADPFLLLGVQMAVDGTDAELIEVIMRSEMEATGRRHKLGKNLLDSYARFAPAFGMIGTLLGLIIMLGNMSDPSAIGPGMAVALITTLYGAIISNWMCIPMAEKLGINSKKEFELREIILRGILSIQAGDNPRVVEQKLMTYLPKKDRDIAKDKAA
jgi:chemotaxis protein MotA